MSKKNRDESFTPPRLSFVWLATTFILPLVILILPDLLTKDDIPFLTKAVIALSVLVVFLFVSCLVLLLSIYDISFRLQVMKLKLDDGMKMLETMKMQEDEIHTLQEQLKELKSAKDFH